MATYKNVDNLPYFYRAFADKDESEWQKGYFAGVNVVLEALATEPTVTIPQWVSVKERLPEPLQYAVVFACAEDCRAQIGIAEWCGNRWFSSQMFCAQSDIKYWMPIPALPESLT